MTFAKILYGVYLDGKKLISHCFPLAADGVFEVRGLAGVMEAYCDM
jgi:hypothetical protein